jgi:thiamine-monophosphate kinase
MNEFELIDRLQCIVNATRAGLLKPGAVGIGDDAAVLSVEQGQQLLVTTDTLVEGVHFPHQSAPFDIGYKALAVNLSDIAAMGGVPAWFFLALTIPEANQLWLDDFAQGLAQLAASSEIYLAGGDTSSGPLSITITVLGMVDSGRALLRSRAQPGDLIVLSGTTGLAGFGLIQYQQKAVVDPTAWQAFTQPQPRLALGRALLGKATSCIDISDGLAADLGHILAASHVGADVWLERLPCPHAMRKLDLLQRWNLQLGGGDDYELCFTLPATMEAQLPTLAAAAGVSLAVIGRIITEGKLRILQPDGTEFLPARLGYDHFSINRQ